MAALLRVVSEVTAELANELERGSEAATHVPKRRVRRARARRIAAPEHVSDIDVRAARRAFRRAGL